MFSSSEIAEIKALRAEPFESFKELIVVYKAAQTTYVNTNSNYNFAFGANQSDVQQTFTPQPVEIYATVQHLSFLPDQKEKVIANLPVLIANPFVKICVTGENDKAFFQEAVKIVLDNIEFKRVTSNRPRGIFERTYHEFFFERID